MNAVERKPVETRVLNPTASEASYKPKQHSYRKTNLKKKFWHPIIPAPKYPATKCPAPNRGRRNVPDHSYAVANSHHDRWQLPDLMATATIVTVATHGGSCPDGKTQLDETLR